MARTGRQASYYDPECEVFILIYTCFGIHHLQFAEDDDETLYFSGGGDVIGWINTRVYDETGDERFSQGWCPGVLDTNGDGKASKPWNEPGEPVDPSRDTRVRAGGYGIIPHPIDNSVWASQTGPFPGRLVRLDPGNNPPETCMAEVYEPPSIENPNIDPARRDMPHEGSTSTGMASSGRHSPAAATWRALTGANAVF